MHVEQWCSVFATYWVAWAEGGARGGIPRGLLLHVQRGGWLRSRRLMGAIIYCRAKIRSISSKTGQRDIRYHSPLGHWRIGPCYVIFILSCKIKNHCVILGKAPVCNFWFRSATPNDGIFRSSEDTLYFICEAPPPLLRSWRATLYVKKGSSATRRRLCVLFVLTACLSLWGRTLFRLLSATPILCHWRDIKLAKP